MPTETTVDKPETEEENAPLLDFDDISPPPTLRFEGKLYEFFRMKDFGLAKQHELRRQGQEFNDLWQKDKLNRTDSQRLTLLLDQVFHQILDAPKDILDQFSEAQQQSVMLAFFLIPLAEAAQKEAEMEQSLSTLENSSPGSTDSTDLLPPKTETGKT